MIRIAISLAAYEAIASSLPKGAQARPRKPLEVGEGVGLWIDRKTQTALNGERRAGEGYSEAILRLAAQRDSPMGERAQAREPAELAVKAKKRMRTRGTP
jgi:hypothetical protein